MAEEHPKNEDLLAKRLEEAHELLLGRESGQTASSIDAAADQQLMGPKEILGLINRVREQQQQKFVDTPRLDATVVENPTDDAQVQLEHILNTDTSQLGRFQVQERLGQGGFALVFKGLDPDLGRTVALKIPRPETLFTNELRERFVREARTAAALSHPHIVTIYETGTHQSICFLVCEYIEGESLADWMSRHQKPVDARAAAKLIAVLADAVQHAHSRGVMHRDIKPGNILLKLEKSGINGVDRAELTEFELAQAATIADFGLAKFESDDALQTRTGSVIGTPAYMAPEQTGSSKQNVGPQADIYSLGTVLYEVLTSRRPFEASSIVDLISAVNRDEPPPPSRYAPDIPIDLEAICLKCLEKKPEDRYGSARELADDLGRFLNGEPVVARPVTNLNRWVRWVRRNPALATASTLALLFLIGGLAFSSWQWIRAESNLAESIENRDRAERHIDRVELVVDRMLTEVAMVLAKVPEMESLRKSLLEQAMAIQQELVAEETDDPGIRYRTAQAFRRVAQIQYDLGNAKDALVTADRTIKILEELPREDYSDIVSHERSLLEAIKTNVFMTNGQLDQAEQNLKATIDRLSTSLSSGKKSQEQMLLLGSTFRSIGVVKEQKNQPAEALAAFKSAWELINSVPVDEQLSDEYRTIQYRTLNSLAILSRRQGRLDDACKQYEQSMEICTKLIEKRPERIDYAFDFAATALNYANYQFGQRDYPKAATFYELAFATADDLVKRHPGVFRYRSLSVSASVGQGVVLRRLQRFQDALTANRNGIEQAHAIEKQFGPNPRLSNSLGSLNSNLALTLCDVGEFEKAADAYREAISIAQQLVDGYPDNWTYRLNLSKRKSNLGEYYNQLNRPREAEEIMLVSHRLAMDCNAHEPNNPRVQTNLVIHRKILAEICCKLNKHSDALNFAAQIALVRPDRAEGYVLAVTALAECVTWLQETELSAETIRPYVDLSIEMMQKAKELGFSDFDNLESDERIQPLLEVELFRALMK